MVFRELLNLKTILVLFITNIVGIKIPHLSFLDNASRKHLWHYVIPAVNNVKPKILSTFLDKNKEKPTLSRNDRQNKTI
jgi:hypothetical protein